MSGVTTRSRAAAIAGRVDLVSGNFNVPEKTTEALKQIHVATAEMAEKIASTVESADAHDIGRLIAALDQLQQVKNTACDALTLPHVPKH